MIDKKGRIDTKCVTIDTNCAKFPKFKKGAWLTQKVQDWHKKVRSKGVTLTQNV